MALTPEQIADMNRIAGISTEPATPTVSPQDRIAELRKKRAQAKFGVTEKKKSLPRKIASFTGGEKIAAGLGQALAQKKTAGALESVQTRQFDTQADLIKRIREKRAKGEDTSRLEKALLGTSQEITDIGYGTEQLLNPEQLTGKQVIGDALQLATTASAGKIASALGGKAVSGGVQGLRSGRLAGTKFASNIAGKVGMKLTPASVIKPTVQTLGQGLKIGAAAGGKLGLATGALGGISQGLKQDKDAKGIVKEGAKGAVIGGVAGGILGAATGALTGKLNSVKALKSTVGNHVKSAKDTIDAMPEEKIKELGGRGKLFEQNKKDIVDQLRFKGLAKQADKLDDLDVSKISTFDDYDRLVQNTLNKHTKSTKNALDILTPDTKKFSDKNYQELVDMGKIKPKTALSPDKYITSSDELLVADKLGKKLTKNPVANVEVLKNEISKLDDAVGVHLKRHNSIFNTGELRNSLDDALEDVVDLTVSEDRMMKLKKKTIESFIDNLDKNDMESLWKARKAFDRNIETAFRGAPSAQKEMKKALHDAIQSFISERTDDVTYKAFMKQMSSMINVKDIQKMLSAKARGTTGFGQLVKEKPLLKKAIGFAGTAAAAGTGIKIFND